MLPNVITFTRIASILLAVIITTGCASNWLARDLVVNSLEDLANPPDGTVTLRSALADTRSGQSITFDASLNGGTIALSIIGEDHTILKGEVMGMRQESSGPVSYLEGYFERDYGRSALYARKDVVIDASGLPSGITLAWTGGSANPARVLAVYGDLILNNVSITGGYSVAEDISTSNPDDQPWTLARGGAVAVWGEAQLTNCILYHNYCEGDFDSSRDRGAFGGGLYAEVVDMQDCIVSGNTVVGGGAAGGGVYSVGDTESRTSTSTVERSSITGNRISGFFTYGAGVYSDGGGIGNAGTLELINSTIARNVVDYPAPLSFGYWRAGGAYISNGSMLILGCTIVENQVHGVPRIDDLGKQNLAGGIAATIGNAHAVENMVIGHSIIAGNTVHEFMGDVYDHDIFTGSVFYFQSLGYNRLGVLDFSQILVPVEEPGWRSLNRKFYPNADDMDGALLSEVVDLVGGITHANTILSAGVDAGNPVPLYYDPQGTATNRIPIQTYDVDGIYAEYDVNGGAVDDFLGIMLQRLEDHYGLIGFAADFTADFESFLGSVDLDDGTPGNQPYTDPDGDPILTLADTQWFGPAVTWPKELPNYPYIEFWHRLDEALIAESIPGMGVELIGNDAWDTLFDAGPLVENPDIEIILIPTTLYTVGMLPVDQMLQFRPANDLGDIGAIEIP